MYTISGIPSFTIGQFIGEIEVLLADNALRFEVTGGSVCYGIIFRTGIPIMGDGGISSN